MGQNRGHCPCSVPWGTAPSIVLRHGADLGVSPAPHGGSGQRLERVYSTYLQMHTHQTVRFVRQKHAQFGRCALRTMSVMEALELLDALVDDSDPDVDFPNSLHAYQTAEGIRRAHPDKGWFQLAGLLHDLGKVLALFGEPQWAVVGDTFPVGCKVQPSVVFSDSTFQDNPDRGHPLYSTECGMYEPGCSLDKVLMSWGHDGKTTVTALPTAPLHRLRCPWAPWQRLHCPWVQGCSAHGPAAVTALPTALLQ
uniref:Inositol oxygenase n=1 Tax=Nothoprocta perdicaria TaxID=30464 RepID=A0A8C6YV70_NOTPE